ncbi:hypothetical protein KXD93_14575 [Mucilaginibacter sp. BJC16-A38]|uniref:hypothetical protein n=1 Tax=Mucilaginibacter phenanthrenivorans TaxID=1234842 RepID=UPI0021584974|nr:hypothetical protein [Mucilaginibacter phenanthrenivorans]MCR8558878.1 hypothetical protein [Mucilaginibacter phenanthrenivorans]
MHHAVLCHHLSQEYLYLSTYHKDAFGSGSGDFTRDKVSLMIINERIPEHTFLDEKVVN